MTGRAAAIQGGLAALGLISAYFTWQRDAEYAPGSVTILSGSKSDVTRIHYEDPEGAMDLWRQGKDEVWVHVVEKPKAPPPPPKDDKAPKPPAPPPPAPPRDLLGSDAALSLYEKFTPLVSPRGFGVLDAAKLKEIGLDQPKKKLVITIKGDTRQFEIGQPATSSTGEAFIRDTRDGRVYLMPRGVAPELTNPNHMVERKLHKFDTDDYDRITVTAGGKTKDFVHTGKQSITTEGFAPAKTPDKPDQMAKNWHDSLLRLFPMEILGKGEVPTEGAPSTAMRVEYFDGKKSVGYLELAKTTSATPDKAAPDKTISDEPNAQGTTNLYVRTEHLVGWAKVHAGMQSIIADAEKIAAAP